MIMQHVSYFRSIYIFIQQNIVIVLNVVIPLCVCECESQSPYLFFFLKPPHLPLWSAVSLNPDPDPDPGPLTHSLQSSDKQLLHHPAATSPKTSSSKTPRIWILFCFVCVSWMFR